MKLIFYIVSLGLLTSQHAIASDPAEDRAFIEYLKENASHPALSNKLLEQQRAFEEAKRPAIIIIPGSSTEGGSTPQSNSSAGSSHDTDSKSDSPQESKSEGLPNQ